MTIVSETPYGTTTLNLAQQRNLASFMVVVTAVAVLVLLALAAIVTDAAPRTVLVLTAAFLAVLCTVTWWHLRSRHKRLYG
ncbi:MAG: hypothetical protein AB1793_08215 [Candidatus Thermoplasmatota archaeon]